MRNYKQFISGVIVGGLLLSGGNVLANGSSLPSITNWVKYKFNGEEKQLPSGYTTLNYEGHTYVPARFVAEELGAEVDWDVNSNTVIIKNKLENSPVQSENNEQGNNSEGTESENKPEETEKKPTVNYKELPTNQTLNGVSVELYDVDQSNDAYTTIYFRVKNTNEAPMQLVQSSAYLEIDGKQYKHSEVSPMYKDQSWFIDLNEDDDNEGYITIPKVPNEIKKGTVHVEVIQNDRTQIVTNYDFNIGWE